MKDKVTEQDEVRRPPKYFMDAFLRLRSGAFKTNVALLEALARGTARAGGKVLSIPSDAVRGGDCGSLNRHPAFLSALSKAEAQFANALKKIKSAPKINFIPMGTDPGGTVGADPREGMGTGPGCSIVDTPGRNGDV